MALAPGVRLGPYEVIAAIGAGGMGEVYRARDTRLDRDVAMKVLIHPTEPGASRLLPTGGLRHTSATLFPDGKRVLITGQGPDGIGRCYVQDVDGGPPQPISDDCRSLTWRRVTMAIAPDGSAFVAQDSEGTARVYSVTGTARRSQSESIASRLPAGNARRFTRSDGCGLRSSRDRRALWGS